MTLDDQLAAHIATYGVAGAELPPATGFSDFLTKTIPLVDLVKDRFGTDVAFSKVKLHLPKPCLWATSDGGDGKVLLTFFGTLPVASVANPVPLLPDISMDVNGLLVKLTPESLTAVIQMKVEFTLIIPFMS